MCVALARVVLDVDVRDTTVAALAVLADLLVLVGRLGELGDDVPGVEEAGDEAEDAEEDVDDGVGGADAALDPDCKNGSSVIMVGERDWWMGAYLGEAGRGWR